MLNLGFDFSDVYDRFLLGFVLMLILYGDLYVI